MRYEEPLGALLQGEAPAVIGLRIGHVDELVAPREQFQQTQVQGVAGVVAKRHDAIGDGAPHDRGELRADAQPMRLAFGGVFEQRDAVFGLRLEELLAIGLRIRIGLRCTEDLDERQVDSALRSNPGQRLITLHVVVAQIADNEENAHTADGASVRILTASVLPL